MIAWLLIVVFRLQFGKEFCEATRSGPVKFKKKGIDVFDPSLVVELNLK